MSTPKSKPEHKPEHKPEPKHLKPHEKPIDPEKAAIARRANTAENALAAVATARETLPQLTAGKVWNHTAPRGEKEIKGSLDLNEAPVVMLRFSPADGSLLPKGLHGLNESSPEIMETVAGKLKDLVSELVILDGAEFREPEFCWALPVAHRGRIVAHIKVAADGSSVIPDKKAAEEQSKA